MHRPQPRCTRAPYRDPEAALRGRSSKLIPESGFLLSITGLGVMLAGFSGLVGAFRGGTTLKPMDAYRLRQIPDVGAHARIRTGDLFLTKWPRHPGEFDPILAPNPDFGRDHLTLR